MSASSSAKGSWKDRLIFPALCLATIAYLYWKFRRIFQCPECYLFVDSGDGLKNYFTAAYWVNYDPGLWFGGMNYPYGEHPVYTDCQPAWALLMKLVNMVYPMKLHVIGTINMLLILSLAVAAIAMYLLLREFGLPKWYAAIMSLPIVFLSPQIDRFNGHYSLAYVCYMPVFLLLFVRWHKRGLTWKGGIGLLVWIIWMGFTHLYFFFMATAFIAAYAMITWIRQKLRWSRDLTMLCALIIAAGLTVYVPVKLTDPVKDRPQEVYGLYVYTATPAGTFLPWYGNWQKTWHEDYDMKVPDMESRSYLGILGVLLMPFVLVYALLHLIIRRKRRQDFSETRISPGTVAWAGFLVWILATGWFYLAGGSILLKTFPVLGQFRSLGRLSWVFYYTQLCFSAWLIYYGISTLRQQWLKIVATSLATILVGAWVIEANAFTTKLTSGIYHPNEVFRGGKPYLGVLHEHNLHPEDFQAILQIPLTLVGNDNVFVSRGLWEFNKTMQCAWETGLPIINFNMSRTSVDQTLSALQLISTPDIPKRRLADMNEKPLLLTTYQAQHLPTEQHLVALADSLGQVGTMQLYRLDISAFTQPSPSDTTTFDTLLYDGFDSVNTALTLEGQGALRTTKDQVFINFTDTAGTGQMTFSCWVHLGADTPGFPAFHVVEFDTQGKQISEETHSIHSFDPWEVRGDWVEVTFLLPGATSGARYDFSVLNSWAILDNVTITKP